MKTTNFLLVIIVVLLLLNLVNKSWFVTEANAQASAKKNNTKGNVLEVRIVGVAQGVDIPVTTRVDSNGIVQQPLGIVVLNKKYAIGVPIFEVNK